MLNITSLTIQTWKTNGGNIDNITFNNDMYKGSPESQFFQFLVENCGYVDIKVLKEYNINHQVLERMEGNGR